MLLTKVRVVQSEIVVVAVVFAHVLLCLEQKREAFIKVVVS